MAILELEEQKSRVILENNCNISSKPLENFLYALKASETKRQYPKRLKAFFLFLSHFFVTGTISSLCTKDQRCRLGY